jgi:FkbM family methyltransferase
MDAFDTQRSLINLEHPIIFDVGAYIGDVTAKYRSMYPKATIFAIEPSPDSIMKLSDRFKNDPRVYPNKIALSHVNGSHTLNQNTDPRSNSLLEADAEGVKYWGNDAPRKVTSILVETTTLDLFAQRSSIDHIDILKLDVQGYETYVLAGAIDMLSWKAISLIYMEVLLSPMYIYQEDFDDIIVWLRQYGYRLLGLFNPVMNGGRIICADAIFVPMERINVQGKS